MATSNDVLMELREFRKDTNDRLRGLEASVVKINVVLDDMAPTLEKVNTVVIVGNGEDPLRKSVRDLVKQHAEEKAEKVKCDEEKKDDKKKLKFQVISSLVAFAVVNIGGWVLAYIYILLPMLPHK